MTSSRRLLLHSIFLIVLFPITGCTDLAGDIIADPSNLTDDQRKSVKEEANADSAESECTLDIRLRLDSVLESHIEKEPINPIHYSNLSTGEKRLIETATDQEKCIHPNRRPEIGLIESRIKQHNDDGTVYLVWDGFYYRVHYETGEEELAC